MTDTMSHDSGTVAPEDGAAKTRTRYLIFVPTDGKDGWRETGSVVEAISSEAAVREYVKSLGGPQEGSQYVAVAERSWRPIGVSVKRSERLIFE